MQKRSGHVRVKVGDLIKLERWRYREFLPIYGHTDECRPWVGKRRLQRGTNIFWVFRMQPEHSRSSGDGGQIGIHQLGPVMDQAGGLVPHTWQAPPVPFKGERQEGCRKSARRV